jgi:hypothetical protein
MNKRPVFITAMSIVMMLSSAVQVLFGALIVAKHNDPEFLDNVDDLSSSHALAIGIGLLVGSVISLVLAIGLLRGSRAVRNTVGAFEVVQIAAGVYSIATLDSAHRSNAYGVIACAVVILYYLFFTEKSKAFFAQS